MKHTCKEQEAMQVVYSEQSTLQKDNISVLLPCYYERWYNSKVCISISKSFSIQNFKLGKFKENSPENLVGLLCGQFSFPSLESTVTDKWNVNMQMSQKTQNWKILFMDVKNGTLLVHLGSHISQLVTVIKPGVSFTSIERNRAIYVFWPTCRAYFRDRYCARAPLMETSFAEGIAKRYHTASHVWTQAWTITWMHYKL